MSWLQGLKALSRAKSRERRHATGEDAEKKPKEKPKIELRSPTQMLISL
jgi:hypothetical protein